MFAPADCFLPVRMEESGSFQGDPSPESLSKENIYTKRYVFCADTSINPYKWYTGFNKKNLSARSDGRDTCHKERTTVMNNRIFREKTIARVSSAEELNDYIRVSNPGIWMILAAVVVLLVGVCVWGIFGHMDTKVPAAAIVGNGEAVFLVREQDAEDIAAGGTATIQNHEMTISLVSDQMIPVTEEMGERILRAGQLQPGEWVCPVSAKTDLPDGVYPGEVVIESVPPMSFILN